MLYKFHLILFISSISLLIMFMFLYLLEHLEHIYDTYFNVYFLITSSLSFLALFLLIDFPPVYGLYFPASLHAW